MKAWVLSAALLSLPAQAGELSLYLRGGGKAYLAASRTAGGVGGGVGLRLHVAEPWFAQLDAAYLTQIGNVAEVRLGAGWQRPGFWRPAGMVVASVLLGDQLSFLTPDHLVPVGHPAFSLGLSLGPLRFERDGVGVSLLEVELGVGTELPGLAFVVGVTLLETSFRF